MHALLDQAATYYTRTLWETIRDRSPATTSTGRGLGEEICREFRLGLALGGDSLARKARRRDSRPRSFGPRAPTGARRRLLRTAPPVPARRCARPRCRLPGPQAPRRRSVAGEVRQHAGVGAVPQGRGRLRPRPVARLDRARGPSVRRRGEHRRARAPAGRFRAVVACMGTALTERQLTELGRLTKRLWLASTATPPARRPPSAGWSSPSRQGFDVQVVALPPGVDPADDPAGFQRSSRRRRRISCTAFVSRSTAPKTARPVPDGEGAPRRSARLSGTAGRVALRERQARHDGSASRGAARRPVRLRRRHRGRSTRARSSSAARSPASYHEQLRPLLAELSADHFYDDATVRFEAISSTAPRSTRRASACWLSSTPTPKPRGSARRPAPSCCCAYASASSSASSVQHRSTDAASSPRRWRGSASGQPRSRPRNTRSKRPGAAATLSAAC